jgi:hypothetical protein
MGEQVAIQKKSKADCAYKKLSITNGSVDGLFDHFYTRSKK